MYCPIDQQSEIGRVESCVGTGIKSSETNGLKQDGSLPHVIDSDHYLLLNDCIFLESNVYIQLVIDANIQTFRVK